MGIQSVWFRPGHFNDPEKIKSKKDYEDTIRNSRVMIDRVLEILEAKIESVDNTETSSESYTEGWAYRQAFINGQKQVLKELTKLFTIT